MTKFKKLKNKKNMKNIFKIIAISFIMVLAILISTPVQADPPGMPDNHGTNGDVPGGGAPIGGGLFILLGLAAAYGGRKIYNLRKEHLED